MNKLLIFYLTDNKRHFTFNHFCDLLNYSKHKEHFKLLILTHTNDTLFYNNNLSHTNINFDIVQVEHNDNYMKKIETAVQYAETNNYEYMMKCDNDIFIHGNLIDYFIENLHLLKDSKNLTLGPILSTGIPSVDLFIDQFCNDSEKEYLYKLCKNTKFEFTCHVDYSPLNQFTINSETWNLDNFYEGVKQLNHYYKGIHPVRVNFQLLDEINKIIIREKDKIFNSGDFSTISLKRPYLCNSIFCINRDVYKSIINDKSLFVDPFEEVPLNKYAQNNNLNHLFVNNGFALHLIYNWFNNNLSYEQDFCKFFFE
jgi:hypothetical protein